MMELERDPIADRSRSPGRGSMALYLYHVGRRTTIQASLAGSQASPLRSGQRESQHESQHESRHESRHAASLLRLAEAGTFASRRKRKPSRACSRSLDPSPNGRRKPAFRPSGSTKELLEKLGTKTSTGSACSWATRRSERRRERPAADGSEERRLASSIYVSDDYEVEWAAKLRDGMRDHFLVGRGRPEQDHLTASARRKDELFNALHEEAARKRERLLQLQREERLRKDRELRRNSPRGGTGRKSEWKKSKSTSSRAPSEEGRHDPRSFFDREIGFVRQRELATKMKIREKEARELEEIRKSCTFRPDLRKPPKGRNWGTGEADPATAPSPNASSSANTSRISNRSFMSSTCRASNSKSNKVKLAPKAHVGTEGGAELLRPGAEGPEQERLLQQLPKRARELLLKLDKDYTEARREIDREFDRVKMDIEKQETETVLVFLQSEEGHAYLSEKIQSLMTAGGGRGGESPADHMHAQQVIVADLVQKSTKNVWSRVNAEMENRRQTLDGEYAARKNEILGEASAIEGLGGGRSFGGEHDQEPRMLPAALAGATDDSGSQTEGSCSERRFPLPAGPPDALASEDARAAERDAVATDHELEGREQPPDGQECGPAAVRSTSPPSSVGRDYDPQPQDEEQELPNAPDMVLKPSTPVVCYYPNSGAGGGFAGPSATTTSYVLEDDILQDNPVTAYRSSPVYATGSPGRKSPLLLAGSCRASPAVLQRTGSGFGSIPLQAQPVTSAAAPAPVSNSTAGTLSQAAPGGYFAAPPAAVATSTTSMRSQQPLRLGGAGDSSRFNNAVSQQPTPTVLATNQWTMASGPSPVTTTAQLAKMPSPASFGASPAFAASPWGQVNPTTPSALVSQGSLGGPRRVVSTTAQQVPQVPAQPNVVVRTQKIEDTLRRGGESGGGSSAAASSSSSSSSGVPSKESTGGGGQNMTVGGGTRSSPLQVEVITPSSTYSSTSPIITTYAAAKTKSQQHLQPPPAQAHARQQANPLQPHRAVPTASASALSASTYTAITIDNGTTGGGNGNPSPLAVTQAQAQRRPIPYFVPTPVYVPRVLPRVQLENIFK